MAKATVAFENYPLQEQKEFVAEDSLWVFLPYLQIIYKIDVLVNFRFTYAKGTIPD